MNIPTMPNYVGTASGGKYYLMEPSPDQIKIEDIAAGLARQTRYNGQYDVDNVEHLYVVAQHSVYVSKVCLMLGRPDAALWALLHDGIEAFLGDLASPIKVLLPLFGIMETLGQLAMIDALNIKYDAEIAEIVHRADLILLHAEVSEFGTLPAQEYGLVGNPPFYIHDIDPEFHFWTPKDAHEKFMTIYKSLKENSHG